MNNVVKKLIVYFRRGVAYSPGLLVTDTTAAAKSPAEIEGVRPRYLDMWGPVDHRHPTRALLSFLYRFPGRCRRLHRFIRHDRVAVINPHFPGLGCLTFVIMKKLHIFRGKIILSFHRGDIRLALATKGMERVFWKILLRWTDHIAVVSDDLGADVLNLAPAAAQKVRTIYNGVDLDMFAASGGEGVRRRRCSEAPRTIVSVGQFISRKGHDVLLKAFSKISERFPDVRLVLIGQDGPDLEKVRCIVDSPTLTGRVDIHVNLPHGEVCRLLSDADLYASASRGEGFPLAVLEAAAARLPVICTRAPGLRELVSDGITGRVVEVDDVDAFARAIVDSVLDVVEAERMAATMFKFIAENLSWHQTYHQYISLVRG